MRKRIPLIERLKRRSVQTKSGCLEWTGFRKPPMGYGMLQGRGSLTAHRASWIAHFGPIPKGMYVLHRCDNPPCWNPEHLFLGTAMDNSADCKRKGRMRRSFKLTPEQVAEVKADARPTKDIAAEYGITVRWVNQLKSGIRG